MTPQKYPQNLHASKNIIFSENTQEYFGLRMCENIRDAPTPPPPPPPQLGPTYAPEIPKNNPYYENKTQECDDKSKNIFRP